MKKLLLAVFCFSFLAMQAQENNAQFDGHKWEAPYSFPIPKDWTIERFLLPPFFAPEITYKGVEDIRFTPGWANSKSDEYWSYAFVWYLDEKPPVNKASIEKDLKAYYTGLLKVNTDSSKHANEKPLVVKTDFQPAKSLPGDWAAYTGTVYMRDFLSREPITLHCIIRARSCTETGKTFLFFELSPKSFEHVVWKSLDQLWQDFKCKKE